MPHNSRIGNRDTLSAYRPRRRRTIAGVGLLALTIAVAVATSVTVRPPSARATGVALGDDAPMIHLPAALVHTVPMPPLPSGPPVAASGGCIGVPILYYHYIRVNPDARDQLGFQLSVTPTNFQAQMDWLRIAGGHPVTLAQVMAAVEGGPPLPARPVVLTFDDGHDDFATQAVPVLVKNHFVATSFVVPGFLGRPEYMTQEQVQQAAQQGMVIGAHTVHHVDLTRVATPVAQTEIVQSKALLEQLIGHAVDDFAYPYGSMSAGIAAMVAQSGFHDASATTGGTQQCLSNRFGLHRLEVLGSESLAGFAGAAGVPPPPPNWVDPGPPPPV